LRCLKILDLFQKQFLPENDPLSAERLDLWNYYEVDLPFMNGYDEDWAEPIRECW